MKKFTLLFFATMSLVLALAACGESNFGDGGADGGPSDSCPDNFVRDGDTCVPCEGDACEDDEPDPEPEFNPCPDGFVFEDGACQPGSSNPGNPGQGGCPPGFVQVDDDPVTCDIDDDSPGQGECPPGTIQVGTNPVTCDIDDDDGPAPLDCPSGYVEFNGACVEDPDDDPPPDGVCPPGFDPVPGTDPLECRRDNDDPDPIDCPPGYVEFQGVCVEDDDDDPNMVNCPPGYTEFNGICIEDPDDTPPNDDAECPPGFDPIPGTDPLLCFEDPGDEPDPVDCPSGFTEVNGVCLEDPDDDDPPPDVGCAPDEVLIDNQCVDFPCDFGELLDASGNCVEVGGVGTPAIGCPNDFYEQGDFCVLDVESVNPVTGSGLCTAEQRQCFRDLVNQTNSAGSVDGIRETYVVRTDAMYDAPTDPDNEGNVVGLGSLFTGIYERLDSYFINFNEAPTTRNDRRADNRNGEFRISLLGQEGEYKGNFVSAYERRMRELDEDDILCRLLAIDVSASSPVFYGICPLEVGVNVLGATDDVVWLHNEEVCPRNFFEEPICSAGSGGNFTFDFGFDIVGTPDDPSEDGLFPMGLGS